MALWIVYQIKKGLLFSKQCENTADREQVRKNIWSIQFTLCIDRQLREKIKKKESLCPKCRKRRKRKRSEKRAPNVYLVKVRREGVDWNRALVKSIEGRNEFETEMGTKKKKCSQEEGFHNQRVPETHFFHSLTNHSIHLKRWNWLKMNGRDSSQLQKCFITKVEIVPSLNQKETGKEFWMKSLEMFLDSTQESLADRVWTSSEKKVCFLNRKKAVTDHNLVLDHKLMI